MSTLTFKGGIHPHDEKSHTSQEKIISISPKKDAIMIFPMHQNIGAPCKPVVEIGERVLVGQKIGDTDAMMSAPIHSSISGIVKSIGPTITTSGRVCEGIFIVNDGEDEEHPSIKDHINEDYTTLSKEEILNLIREGGVIGLGGAGFPTTVKLNVPPDKKIDTIIINAAECEPYLTLDNRLLIEETERFIRGVNILLHIFKDANAIIGIETNKPESIEKLEDYLSKNSNPRISIAKLQPKYPQGAEKQIIYSCTQRMVPVGGLPADVGTIVNNVDTIIAIERAVVRKRSLRRRVITVTGNSAVKPGNYKVRLGMTIQDFFDNIGGFKDDMYKLVAGGPMMGVAIYDFNTPISKTSSGFLCFNKKAAIVSPEKNCIRCGKCVDICPMGLVPLDLNLHAMNNEMELFLEKDGLSCIECGACSFICPAKRHLTQSIRLGKYNNLSNRK